MMKLEQILEVAKKVDGRKKISSKVDLKSSLFQVTDEGKYEIHISCFFPSIEIEKVAENILANLKRLGVKQFTTGKGDGSADKLSLIKHSERFIFDEWHLSIFVTVG